MESLQTNKKSICMTYSGLSEIPKQRGDRDFKHCICYWSMDHFHLVKLFIPFPSLGGKRSNRGIVNHILRFIPLRSTSLKSLKLGKLCENWPIPIIVHQPNILSLLLQLIMLPYSVCINGPKAI